MDKELRKLRDNARASVNACLAILEEALDKLAKSQAEVKELRAKVEELERMAPK